jgi:hypothetical protein
MVKYNVWHEGRETGWNAGTFKSLKKARELAVKMRHDKLKPHIYKSYYEGKKKFKEVM